MRTKSLRVGAALAALGIAACGSKTANPAAPTVVVTPTVTSIAVSPATDLLKINGSETFTLTATLSDGTTKSVTGSWSSDASGVVSVDGNGRAMGVSSGEATITAESQSQRVTRRLRSVPDYQGRWSGDSTVITCSADGDWATIGFCSAVPNGSLSGVILNLTQNREAITGNADFGGLAGAVQGTIATNGQLTLTGKYIATDEGLTVEVTVAEFQVQSTDNQRMTGKYVIEFRIVGVTGAARVGANLRIVSKGAAVTAPVSLFRHLKIRP